MTYTIHDVAAYISVTKQSLIDAEKEGRIPVPRRDELGARVYDESERDRVAALMGRR